MKNEVQGLIEEMDRIEVSIDNRLSEFIKWANTDLIGKPFDDVFGCLTDDAVIVDHNSGGVERKVVTPKIGSLIEFTVHLNKGLITAIFADRSMPE